MNCARTFAAFAAIGFVVSGNGASAQDLSRYRTYALESSLESVIAASGARTADRRTVHERPARIEQLEWRAPYAGSSGRADPVRQITFTFYDDALYEIVVSYDRNGTDGLTNEDVIESLSAVYGIPVLGSSRAPAERRPPVAFRTIAVARWENATSALTLLRQTDSSDFRLIVTSKPLSALARNAVREAVRLDALDAPRLAEEQRAAAGAARDRLRSTNRAAFHP